MDIDHEQFVSFIRSALHYLYDPEQLRRSPLTGLFGLSGRVDASFALQKILIDAVEGIRPAEQEPPSARGWLLHDVLYFRYVRGYERHAVAGQLGISERQLSRDQRAALELLAQHLWQTHQLEGSATPSTDGPMPGSPPADGSTPAESMPPTPPAAGQPPSPTQPDPGPPAPPDTADADSPAAWLDDLPVEKPSAWKPALHMVLELLGPLAGQNQVELALAPTDELPDLLVPQHAFRHALLNLLGWLIPLAQGRTLTLTPAVQDQSLTITAALPAQAPSPEAQPGPAFAQPALAAAQGLLERAGGSLHLDPSPTAPSARLTLPAIAQVPVLVIDDNPDTILLFQRYVQGTRYNLVGAASPDEFNQQLEALHPRILVLDVMMPELDGWDLLSRLTQDRPPGSCAIIICSILPQKDLAQSLGADAFLQKPVLPQDFLQALDRQMAQLTPEPGS